MPAKIPSRYSCRRRLDKNPPWNDANISIDRYIFCELRVSGFMRAEVFAIGIGKTVAVYFAARVRAISNACRLPKYLPETAIHHALQMIPYKDETVGIFAKWVIFLHHLPSKRARRTTPMGRSDTKGDISKEQVDHDQLTEYARLYEAPLTRYFAKRGCQNATVQDLVQDVFIRLARRSADSTIEHPEAYLMQTASSVWNDFLRGRQRRHHADHLEYDETLHTGADFSPERVLEGRQEVERLMAALQQLPPRTRQAYLLCRVEGMKRKHVAERMGITVSGIEKHLVKATRHIGELFGDDT